MKTDEQQIFEVFAKVYPHEMYDLAPERFWQFFQRERPGISREKMEQILKEIEDEV